ncbi:MAG: hypothetical protein ACYC6A_07315 [Armatimonadota bacterium]
MKNMRQEMLLLLWGFAGLGLLALIGYFGFVKPRQDQLRAIRRNEIESAREYRQFQAERDTCISNMQTLLTAAEMYAQDHHGRYPGGDWVKELSPYCGDDPKVFSCPAAEQAKGITQPVTYGYSGLLLGADGKGIKSSQILSPAEVGIFGDVAPTKGYPQCGVIGGGGLLPVNDAVEPDDCHRNRVMIGYADGHTKLQYSWGRSYDRHDLDNKVSQAFYFSSLSEDTDNPVGGVSDFTPAGTSPEPVVVGGEYCTRAILLAAGEVWKVKAKAPILDLGFHGQYAKSRRPANYLWGTGDGKTPSKNAVPIAQDELLIIVKRWSKIPAAGGMINSAYPMDIPALRQIFMEGNCKNSVTVYTMNTNSGTRRFFENCLSEPGKPFRIGKRTTVVKNDAEMASKVAADPYGIGYCSSAMYDKERLLTIAIKTPDGVEHYYPRRSTRYRWVVPDSPDWPWTRTLYAEYGGAAWKADGSGIANVMLAPGGAGTEALRRGPLFGTGLWGP